MIKKPALIASLFALALALGAAVATVSAAPSTDTVATAAGANICLDNSVSIADELATIDVDTANFICVPNTECSSDFECGNNGFCHAGRCDCN